MLRSPPDVAPIGRKLLDDLHPVLEEVDPPSTAGMEHGHEDLVTFGTTPSPVSAGCLSKQNAQSNGPLGGVVVVLNARVFDEGQ